MLSSDDLIQRDFLNESAKLLTPVKQQVASLLKDARSQGRVSQPDAANIEQWFHLFHSVKGSAGYLELKAVIKVAETAEAMLATLKNDSIPLKFEHLQSLDNACHFLHHGLSHIARYGTDDELAGLAQAVAMSLQQAVMAASVQDAVNKDDEQETTPMVFITRAQEFLDAMEMDCLCWDETIISGEHLDEFMTTLRRFFESCRYYGFTDLELLSRTMLEVMERFQSGETFLGQHPEEAFLDCIDRMKNSLHDKSTSSTHGVAGAETLVAKLKQLIRAPIGEILVDAGLVGEHVVQQALRVQDDARKNKQEPQRIGDLLVSMGEITEDQIDSALSRSQKVSQPTEGIEDVSALAEDQEDFVTTLTAQCKKLATLAKELVEHEDIQSVQTENFKKQSEKFILGVRRMQKILADSKIN